MPKPDKPARERERAPKGDTSNEGAQDERDALRKFVERRITKINQRAHRLSACEVVERQAYIEVREFLDGRTARFAARKGGLKGPGRKVKP